MIKLTIFTPTFNREEKLAISYEKLCKQTCKEFIWLIVDDGSTDNTKDLISKWILDDNIKIKYLYQKNAGKQMAVNTGVKHCDTELFGFLDSDDFYCYDTVENILKDFNEIKNYKNVAGIMARRGTDENHPIGSKNIPSGKYIMNYDKLYKKYKYYGDTCRVYYTKILKNNLYPEIGEKFIPESVMFSKIDLKYDLYVVNEVYSISKYLSDGYTCNALKLYKRYPLGYSLGLLSLTKTNRGVLRKIKYYLIYIIWCRMYNINIDFKKIENKLLYLILYPIAIILSLFKWPKNFF